MHFLAEHIQISGSLKSDILFVHYAIKVEKAHGRRTTYFVVLFLHVLPPQRTANCVVCKEL